MAKLDLSVCVHNESFGTKYDVANVAFDGYRTLAAEAGLVRDTALTMKQTWMSYFEINPQGFVIHPCHSGGATHTLSALKEMPEELRNRVCVLAIAPQVMIGKQWCRHAIHVGTDRDEVFARAKKNNEEICSDVRVVDSTVIRDQDHANRSATIKEEIQNAIGDLLRKTQ